tara:strand:+ start:144 stop:656 length:513 start_codon:yes stop_codon:yes gene_type:complete
MTDTPELVDKSYQQVDWKDKELNHLQLKIFSKCFDLAQESGSMKCDWNYDDGEGYTVSVHSIFDNATYTDDRGIIVVTNPKITKLHNYGNLPIVLEMIGETVDVLTNKKKEFHLRTSVLNWSTHPHWQDKEGVDAFRKLFEHIDENVEREVEPIEDCLDDDGNDYNWYWR